MKVVGLGGSVYPVISWRYTNPRMHCECFSCTKMGVFWSEVGMVAKFHAHYMQNHNYLQPPPQPSKLSVCKGTTDLYIANNIIIIIAAENSPNPTTLICVEGIFTRPYSLGVHLHNEWREVHLCDLHWVSVGMWDSSGPIAQHRQSSWLVFLGASRYTLLDGVSIKIFLSWFLSLFAPPRLLHLPCLHHAFQGVCSLCVFLYLKVLLILREKLGEGKGREIGRNGRER